MAKNLTPDQIAGLPADDDQGRGLPAGGRALPLLQPEGRGAAARGGLGGGALPRRLPGHDRHHPQGPDGDPPGVLAQGLPRLARRDPVHLRPGEGEADPRRRRGRDADQRHPRRDQLRALHRHGAVAAGELRRGRHQLRDPARHRQPGDHQVPRPQPPGDAALLGPGLHGPALQRQGLRLQRRQLRRRLRRDHHLAQRLGGARGDERADARRPLRARPRQAARDVHRPADGRCRRSRRSSSCSRPPTRSPWTRA